jgi:Fur family ferric uptake transcriptional regulator
MITIQTAKESFTRYLREGKYRITPERFAVLEKILTTDGHFDADELFLKLKTGGSKVSRATVYNTLDLLEGCGLVLKHSFGENHSHYEKGLGRFHHDHLICVRCGAIIEFANNRITRLQNEICREKNFRPHSSSFQIFGKCEKCQKEE